MQLRLGFSGYSTRGGTSFSSSSGLRSNWSSGRTLTSRSSCLCNSTDINPLTSASKGRSQACHSRPPSPLERRGEECCALVRPVPGGIRAIGPGSERLASECRSRLRHGGFGSHFASPAPSAKLVYRFPGMNQECSRGAVARNHPALEPKMISNNKSM